MLCFGLPDETAVEAMCLAHGTPFEVSGAVHMHADLAERFTDEGLQRPGASVTAIRVENLPASARYRAEPPAADLQAYGPALELETGRSKLFWDEMRHLAHVSEDRAAAVADLDHAVERAEARRQHRAQDRRPKPVYDWSGGLIWLETPPLTDAGAAEIRRTLAEFGGHATLIRAERRGAVGDRRVPAARPPLAALTARVKQAFDPAGILNPGRMYPGI